VAEQNPKEKQLQTSFFWLPRLTRIDNSGKIENHPKIKMLRKINMNIKKRLKMSEKVKEK
jgi:hypothetical protein